MSFGAKGLPLVLVLLLLLLPLGPYSLISQINFLGNARQDLLALLFISCCSTLVSTLTWLTFHPCFHLPCKARCIATIFTDSIQRRSLIHRRSLSLPPIPTGRIALRPHAHAQAFVHGSIHCLASIGTRLPNTVWFLLTCRHLPSDVSCQSPNSGC